jgi:hypothetical protein
MSPIVSEKIGLLISFRYSEESQARIRSRWEEEKRVSEFERQAAARELLGGE